MKGEKFKIFLSSNGRQQTDGLHMSKFRAPHVQKQIIPKPLLFKEKKEKTPKTKTSVWQPGPCRWNSTLLFDEIKPCYFVLIHSAFSKFIKIVDSRIKWEKVFFLMRNDFYF